MVCATPPDRSPISLGADPLPEIDALSFRKSAGQFLTGVTIVTTLEADGNPRGVTANSFTTVSLDPPLVLVCVGKSSRSYAAFAQAGRFAVNILSTEQKGLSATFASKAEDKFAGTGWMGGVTGAPLFPNCLAWFDCLLHNAVDAGDHIVLIGRVVGHDRSTGTPLGYFGGNYVDFGVQRESSGAQGGQARFGALLRRDEALLFHRAGENLTLPFAGTLEGEGGGEVSLLGLLGTAGIVASLNFAYSVFTEPGDVLTTIYLGDIANLPSPLPDEYALLAPDEIPFDRIDRLQGLIRRYLRERAQDAFGLYVGNVMNGTVHRLPSTRSR